jgi:hypothetical protein
VTSSEPPSSIFLQPENVDASDVIEAEVDASVEQAPSAPKKLPEANEFSPGQINVRKLLEIAHGATGDRDAIIEGVRVEFFADAAQAQADPDKRLEQQRTRAYNAVLGASKYGLVEPDLTALTSLGSELLATTDDDQLHALLARHIIRHLHGLDVLLALREMQSAGEKITKTTLQEFLESRAGFAKLPRATVHHTKLLQFLREAGVLPVRGYEIDAQALGRVAGLSLDVANAWAGLADEQRAFLRVLRKMALVEGGEPMPARAVVDATVTEYGPIFRRPDQLAASVFGPLAEAGWISHSGSGSGRGGKSGDVAATQKLLATEVDLLPEGDGWGIPSDLRSKLQTPLRQIYAELSSSDTHTKGIALELLAIRIAIDLSLTPTRLRERGVTTGGAEVDLVAEGAHLHFSRWLLQCKNTRKVHVAALAKEVGMAVLLKAHVVVIVTTGTFSPAVETYAKELAATTPLQVVLVDESVLDAYKASGPNALRRHFHDCARQALTVKRPQVVGNVDA